MAAGLGHLRLPPAHFWSMTPRELAAALRAVLGSRQPSRPPARRDLASLMARFPDSIARSTSFGGHDG
jgi:uncharacterized phage protein (TIGR02216 family)